MRYPIVGDFQFMLVSVYPYHGESKTIVEMMNVVRTKLQDIDILLNNPSPYVSDIEKLLNWFDHNPKKAAIVIFFIAFLLFGDRVLEIGDALFNILN